MKDKITFEVEQVDDSVFWNVKAHTDGITTAGIYAIALYAEVSAGEIAASNGDHETSRTMNKAADIIRADFRISEVSGGIASGRTN